MRIFPIADKMQKPKTATKARDNMEIQEADNQ